MKMPIWLHVFIGAFLALSLDDYCKKIEIGMAVLRMQDERARYGSSVNPKPRKNDD